LIRLFEQAGWATHVRWPTTAQLAPARPGWAPVGSQLRRRGRFGLRARRICV